MLESSSAPTAPAIDMTGWTDEQRVAYTAALAALTDEAEALEDALAEDERRASAPEALIAEIMEEANAKRAERLHLARERQDDALYAELCKKHGGERRVARIIIPELGSIFQRAPTRTEYDEMTSRVADLSESDRVAVVKEHVLDMLLAPARPVVDAMLGDHPALWVPMIEAHHALISVEAEVVKKKGRSSPKRPSNTRR